MATVKNVAPLLNYVNEQAGGIYGAEVTDLDSFVSMGDVVLSSASNVENFTQTLCDVISKTIEMVRAYKPNTIDVISHADEWGAILRAVDVELIEAVENPAYNLTDGQSVDPFVVNKPDVKQMLFSNFDAWEYDITIPDIQWKTAFHNPEEMQAVINAIFTSLANSKARDLENATRTAYNNLVGENVVATKGGACKTVINLLAEYNTAFSKSLTTSNCIYDPEFDRYATYRISDIVKTMQGMQTLYNPARRNKFTPKENMRVLINSQFASACKMYLQSDVFYKDLVELPKYSEVAYWQSVGNGERNFEDATDINIRTASGSAVFQHGVIAVLADDETVGVMRKDERTKAQNNPRGEYTNYFAKCDMGYYNNMLNQSVVFVVADVAIPTKSKLSKYSADSTIGSEADIAITFTAATGSGETVSSLKVGSTTLTSGTDYTVSSGTYTLLSTWIDDLGAGDTTVSFVLSTGAVLPFVIHHIPAAT